MNCQTFKERFWDFYDRRLTPVEEADFKAHLGSCTSCDAYDAQWRDVVHRTWGQLPKPPNPYAVTRIMAAIDEEEKIRAGNWRLEWVLRWAAGMSVMVVLGMTYWLGPSALNAQVEKEGIDLAMTLRVDKEQLALPLSDQDTISYDDLTGWLLEPKHHA